jgi:ribosomal protein L7Ae-like RNA K-turn-binding protein
MVQFIYAGKNAALTIGNVLHLSLLCKDKNVSYVYVLSKKALELSCK